MEQQDLPNTPCGKHNAWCQRRALVCSDQDRYRRATTFFARRDLAPSERAAFYLHELTGCEGLEFVAFSNAKLERPVGLANNVTIVPCFLDQIAGHIATDPLVQASMRMAQRARLIYDGWVPIAVWDEEHVRQAVQSIDQALSTFCICSGVSFEWEPKYPTPNDPRLTYKFEDEDLQGLKSVAGTLDSLEKGDRTAIYRGLAWLSQGIRLDEPAARFLFSILAIESLATYIEERASDSSPLAVLRTRNVTETELEECIRDALAKWLEDDPREAIERAYFDCVVSITQRLKGHLQHIFASDAESYTLLFKHKVEGKTLYDLRHYVAHGRANALSEAQREQIRQRVWDAERVARRYVWAVFEQALDSPPVSGKMQAASPGDLQNVVAGREGMYRGPTHMAVLYSQ